MNDTDVYERQLLEKQLTNARLVIGGGLAMILGPLAIIAFTWENGGSVVFYGAFLAGFGVVAKGMADLRGARAELAMFDQDQR